MQKNMQIEGLRGIAISFVVISHVFNRFQEIYLGVSINGMGFLSKLGVMLFIIISCWFLSAKKEMVPFNTFKNFFKKKIIRLWPCYFACINITFVVVHLVNLPERTCSLSDYILNIFFVNGFTGSAYVDASHWYLTTLIGLSICFGLISSFGFELHFGTYIAWLFVGVIAHAFDFNVLKNLIGGGYEGVACCIFGLKNVINFHNQDSDTTKSKYLPWLIVIVLSIAYTQIYMGAFYICELFVALPIFILANYRKVPLFENRILVLIGTISYPLYLIHQNLSFSIEYLLLTYFGSYYYWFGIIAILVSLILAVILYYVVERRFKSFRLTN